MEKLHGKLQRLLSVWLSLMMALVLLAPSAFADGGNTTITINRGSGIDTDLTGMMVKAYQVLDQVNPDETDVAKKQYQVTEEFSGFFAMKDGEKLDGTIAGYFGKDNQSVVLSYNDDLNKITFKNDSASAQVVAGTIVLTGNDAAQLDETYPEADLVSRLTGMTANVSNTATFYTWIEKYIESKGESLRATTSGNFDADSVTLESLDEGYYALIFSGVPDGVSVKQGILIATPGEIDLKAEEIPVTKQVKNHSHSEDFGSETTANMGDTLDYKITSKVPTLTDTDNLTIFKLSDEMEKQMLTEGDTMTLNVGDATFVATIPTIAEEAESATANFEDTSHNVIAVLTVEPYNSTSKKQKFTVDFLKEKQEENLVDNDTWTSYQGDEITLTYSAKLTADAYNINLNTVTLTINNNNDTTTQTAQTKVYTYGIEVEKTFSDGSDSYSDVKFNLYAADEKGDQSDTVIELVGSNGVYHKKADGETAVNTGDNNLELDSTGKLTITGLDVGTYWLVETNAPDGFTKAEPIKIVLVSSADKTILDKDASTAMYKGTGPEDLLTTVTTQATTNISLGQFKVFNQKGFNLPQTGGAGTWMFTVGGIVLIAVAGVLFLASRKKRSSK